MSFHQGPSQPVPAEAFRAALREWVGKNLAPLDPAKLDDAGRRRNSQLMYDAGFLGLTWPLELGGRGLAAEYQTIWNEELREYEWALPYAAVTVGICAPTLREFGTAEQKATHISRMLRGDERWTQLLSEPGAGSDLANVATTALLDGQHYIVTGQKVWTSAASSSELALALVRTSREARRHDGLSMLIIDLRSPGVDIRPLREMNGESDFNEVFLDCVKVPRHNLVGSVGEGWAVLMSTLAHERIALGAGTSGGRMDADVLGDLLAISSREGTLRAPHIARALLDLFIEQRVLELNGIRIRRALESTDVHGPVGSIVKVGTASAAESAARAHALVVGMATMAWAETDLEAQSAAHSLLTFPMASIAGGTTEIQKNAIAERLLGLPRGN